MHHEINVEESLMFYKEHLNAVLLPFWINRAMDYEYGGYYTCFDNAEARLISKDKYTWSQGRMVWILSRLSQMRGLSEEIKGNYIKLAKSGGSFLMEHCLLKNGNCTFIMERNGTPKLQIDGDEYDSSIFADCFVIMGLAQYAFASGDRCVFDFSKRLYDSVINRVDQNTYKTEPYPEPERYKMHSIPMIMLNVCHEMADIMKHFDDNQWLDASRRADRFMYEIMDNFVDRDNLLHEMISTGNEFVTDTLLGRYINPGHTIEDMWFVMHQARKTNNHKIIEKAAGILKKTFDVGWDQEYGGIFLFADMNGGKPCGSTKGLEKEIMTQKVLNDWDSKLWWPHSETLYSSLLAYFLIKDADFLEIYHKVFKYTFEVFPNQDMDTGEWIQIRDRVGNPEQRVVGLPVKDPYHIIRNVILIIELLDTHNHQGSGPYNLFHHSKENQHDKNEIRTVNNG